MDVVGAKASIFLRIRSGWTTIKEVRSERLPFRVHTIANTSAQGQLSYVHTTKEPIETEQEGHGIPEETNLTKTSKEIPPIGFGDSSRQSEIDIDCESQAETTTHSLSDPGSIYRSERGDSLPHLISCSPISHTQGDQTQLFFDSPFPQSRDRYPIGPLKGLSGSLADGSYATLEEACLLRYFTESLAHWVRVKLPINRCSRSSSSQSLLLIFHCRPV